MIRLRILVGALACAAPLCAGARASEPASPPAGAPSAPAPAPTPAPIPAQPALPLPASEVVEHVSRSVDWYRHMTGLQQLPANPDDIILRDRLAEVSLTAVRLAFDFGRAAAALASLGSTRAGAASNDAAAAGNVRDGAGNVHDGAGNVHDDAEPATGIGGELDQAAVRLNERIASLQTQQGALDEQLKHAAPKEREALLAQRAEVAAALILEREIQATVAQIERFEESTQLGDSRSNGLARQIADLQRSVPEARRSAAGRILSSGSGLSSPAGGGSGGSSGGDGGASGGPGSAANAGSGTNSAAAAVPDGSASAGAASPTHAAPSYAASTFRPESAGVLALAGEWFTLHNMRGQLTAAAKDTGVLIKETDEVRTAVTHDVRGLALQELNLSSVDTAKLAQARQQLEAAATRFRQLSALLIPLGEQSVMVESGRNLLVEWRNSVTAHSATVSRYLALRVLLLLGSIAVVLAISEIWRRATFRYLHDSRRRAQFLALRRVAVGIALVLVIVFGLVSEVGSVATYAGLITAGLAVALQNVILAVVAYFFLIGRYGVRVGDRITLAGVTGRVVDIGLVRIYLMELTGAELRSSGRMVVLSNSVLFQPAALFKQMPGGDYFWHTITLTLAASTDVQLAQTRLREAADSVYENYRPAIEQQHAALQRFIDFETAMPRPEVYVRLTEKGLECTMRYPVEPARAASIDQKMLMALRETLGKPPELQLVGGPLLNSEA